MTPNVHEKLTVLIIVGQKLANDADQGLHHEWEQAKADYFEAKRLDGNEKAEHRAKWAVFDPAAMADEIARLQTLVNVQSATINHFQAVEAARTR